MLEETTLKNTIKAKLDNKLAAYLAKNEGALTKISDLREVLADAIAEAIIEVLKSDAVVKLSSFWKSHTHSSASGPTGPPLGLTPPTYDGKDGKIE